MFIILFEFTGALSRVTTPQEESRINEAIEHSIAGQNAFLDWMEARRRSTSSTDSTLTELSSCWSEDQEWNTTVERTSTSISRILSPVTNVTRTLKGPAGSIEGPTTVNDANLFYPGSEPTNTTSHSSKKAPASPLKKKKPRRRPKKKTAVNVTEPRLELDHKHQHERMKRFRDIKAQEKTKQTRMRGRLCRQALERAIVVPFEVEQFRASRKVQRDARVYGHDELESLGIRTVGWNGR